MFIDFKMSKGTKRVTSQSYDKNGKNQLHPRFFFYLFFFLVLLLLLL